MPPRTRSQDERLMAAYREAALRIQRTLGDLTPRNRKVILRRIEIIVGELDGIAAAWVQETLPLHYRDGSVEAVKQLRTLLGGEIDDTFGAIHKEALQALAADAKLKFANALEGVRRGAQSAITSAVKQQIIGNILVAEIEGASNPASRVQEVLEEQGITALQGKNRTWTLEDYSAMLTHTVLADAHNSGAATRYAENGVEYARRIEREDCCEICRPLRGKIIWLGDARLLPPTHPSCYGGIAPVIGKPTEEPIMSPDDKRIPAKTRKYLLRKV